MHREFALVSQLFVVIFVLVACNAVTPTPSPTPQATSTPAPRTFLMQQVSMLPTIQEGELLFD